MLLTVWLVYDRWFLFLGLSMTGQCLPSLVCLKFNLVHLVINLVYLVYHLGFDCSLLYDAGSMPLALSWLDNVWQGVFLEHCCSTNIRLPWFCFGQKHNNLPVSMFYLTQVSLGGIVCCDLFLLKYSMFTCAKQFFQSNVFSSNPPHKGLDRVFLQFSCNLPTCPI